MFFSPKLSLAQSPAFQTPGNSIETRTQRSSSRSIEAGRNAPREWDPTTLCLSATGTAVPSRRKRWNGERTPFQRMLMRRRPRDVVKTKKVAAGQPPNGDQ